MKFIIFAYLLFSSLTFAQDHKTLKHNLKVLMAEKTEEIKQAELMNKQWEEDLIEFLVKHPDPNIRIYGIEYLHSRSINPYRETENRQQQYYLKITDLINEIIETDDVSPQALGFIDSMCGNIELSKLCDLGELYSKQYKATAHNISIYVSSLNRAQLDGNQNDIEAILALMAKTKYSNTYQYLSPDFERAIQDYVANNPFPQSSIETHKKVFESLMGISELKLQDIFEYHEEYMIFTLFMSIKLALPIPKYASISKACNNPQTSYEICIKIAEILINDSHSVIATMIGHSMKINLLKSSENEEDYLSAKNAREKFKKIYECLGKIIRPSSDSLDNNFNLEFYKITSPIEREHGEIAGITKQAEMNYKKQTIKGEEAVDPKSCFED